MLLTIGNGAVTDVISTALNGSRETGRDSCLWLGSDFGTSSLFPASLCAFRLRQARPVRGRLWRSTGACRTHVQVVHDVLTASATLPSEEIERLRCRLRCLLKAEWFYRRNTSVVSKQTAGFEKCHHCINRVHFMPVKVHLGPFWHLAFIITSEQVKVWKSVL